MPGNFTDYYICQELITCSLKRMIFVCLIYFSLRSHYIKKRTERHGQRDIFSNGTVPTSVGYNGIEQEDWRQS